MVKIKNEMNIKRYKNSEVKQGRLIMKNRKYQIEINMKMNMNHNRRNIWNQIIEVKCLC